MSPRRPPAPGTGGIPDPIGGSRAPRARVGGTPATGSQPVAKKAAPAAKKAAPKKTAETPPVKKSAATKAAAPRAPRRPDVPSSTAEERAAAAAKKRAAAQRGRTVAAGSPTSHTHAPHKTRTRTTASRSGGLRPTSTRPGSARPRAGTAGRGSRKRGLGAGSGRPVWVLGAVGVMLALLILPYFQKWLVQRSELESVRADVSQATEDVSDLKRQQERWKDEDYVRAQARARLNYVMPGEIGYVVSEPTPDSETSPTDTGDPDVPTGHRSWFSSVWLSAQTAGSEGAAQAGAGVP